MRAFSCLSLVFAMTLMTGCAVVDKFMAGYTPPPTIADLLYEQRLAAGVLPPELAMNGEQDNQIGVEDYKGDIILQGPDERTSLLEEEYSRYREVRAFQPRFTYKSIQDYAAQLSMELAHNHIGFDEDSNVAISSFVLLDESLQNTTILGNQLAEYLISAMQQQGMPVVDHKLMPVLQVTSRGDLSFSRDVLRLTEQKVMDHVLSGTLINKANGVFVNARIISVETNRVVSTATILIPDFVVQSASRGYAANY